MTFLAYAGIATGAILAAWIGGGFLMLKNVWRDEDRANGNPEQLERDERRAGLRK